jgi:large subunit ribosomal protein L15e
VSRFSKDHKNDAKQLTRKRLIQWRSENTFTKIDRPTKLDRARRLGYKPKQGIILVRIKLNRGGRRLIPPTKGRRSKRSGITKITPNQSRQVIAENRVARRYPNLEVLNSYLAGQDGHHLFYEVILVDPFHPVIKADKTLNWLSPDPNNQKNSHARNRGRSFRGLTSAAKKSRGLRNKGKGSENFR